MDMLDDKVVLVTGVVTPDSIAFGVARRALELGAEVVLTALERDLDQARTAAALLGLEDVLAYDATCPDSADRLAAVLRQRHGRLDAALHAIAFAPRAALSGAMTGVDPSGLEKAFRTSTVSYAEVARVLQQLAPPSGASLVGLDFDAGAAWSVYNWMGVCKAARDTAPTADAVRFLFSDMARAVTGEVVHVDGGYHAMAAPLRRDVRATDQRRPAPTGH